MEKFILLMVLTTISRGANMVFIKRAQRGPKSLWQTMLYTGCYCFGQFLLLFILPPWDRLDFSWERLWCPAAYGVLYILYMYLYTRSMNTGPAALTAVICSFNNLLPIAAGVLVWHENVSWQKAVGIGLFVCCLLLFNSGNYSSGEEKHPITLKWLGVALSAMMISGCAVLFTQTYGNLNPGAYIKEYLIFANLVTSVLCVPFVVTGRTRHRDAVRADGEFLKNTFGASCCTDISNIIFMMYLTSFSSAFYFPLTSVLGVLSVLVAGRLVLKEKISPRALSGVALSAVALVFLAIG